MLHERKDLVYSGPDRHMTDAFVLYISSSSLPYLCGKMHDATVFRGWQAAQPSSPKSLRVALSLPSCGLRGRNRRPQIGLGGRGFTCTQSMAFPTMSRGKILLLELRSRL